ncbi:MAG TPA: Smr/MutS family protein [Casimicrobiaceae bacterium]|nr:Smr/MutS family protein [Casimicrobiaceae bacterium]
MAKLSELKRLLDDAGVRTRAKAADPSKPAPAREASSPRRALAAAKHGDADIDLAQAFADVERLAPSKRNAHVRPRAAPIARQRIADEADALAASKFGAEPAPDAWDVGQEHEAGQTYVRRGLGTDVLARLRRGHWAVQGEIDLHGHTTDEAHDALADFLDDARAHGYRCVRVVHGKGLTSPNKEPVLKGKVRKWLSHWDDVLAYCEAPRHAGGGGAVLVLLRGA